MNPDTLPRLLVRNAAGMGRRPAFRLRHRGIWQTLSWAEFAVLSHDFALGLLANGIEPGARLAVVGENRPLLYAATLAVQALGGAGVPLHPEAEPAEISAVLRDAGVSVVVVQDREQAEKLTAAGHDLPKQPLVIGETLLEPAGDQVSPRPDFGTVAAAGRGFAESHPGALESAINAGQSDDPALVLYPPGSGRNAMTVSHRRLLTAASAIAAAEDVRPGDDAFCYLPMTGIGDAIYSLALGLMVGFTCNCPEAPHTVLRDLREIGPRMLLAPPQVWAALERAVNERAATATPLKRRTFSLFRRLALQAERQREAGGSISPVARFFGWVGDVAVNRPVLDQLGLTRLRWAHTGGEPLDPELRCSFRALGVKLRRDETEFAGLIALQPEAPAHA